MIRSGLAGTAGVILCGLRQRLEREYAGRPYDDQLPQARSRSEGKGEDSYAGRRGRMC